MNILILGANADIGYALAKCFAQDKHTMVLASRDMQLLEKHAADLNLRYGTTVKAIYFDALDFKSHAQFYNSLDYKPDIVVAAFGYTENDADRSFEEQRKIIDSNFTGAVSILNIVANDFEARQQGCIVGISSVAGCRGRKSNGIYGSAKAAFTHYLSALRQRLSSSNVYVLTVLPGFVATKMTASMQIPAALNSTPKRVAADIYRGIQRKRNIIYTPWYWRWVMMIITHLPENVFKKIQI